MNYYEIIFRPLDGGKIIPSSHHIILKIVEYQGLKSFLEDMIKISH